MTPQERYKLATLAMVAHVRSMNAIEEEIGAAKKRLREMKEAGLPPPPRVGGGPRGTPPGCGTHGWRTEEHAPVLLGLR